jgi:hypothetical protein
MRSLWQRLVSARRGTTPVEFAVICTVLFVFVFGVMEFAVVLWQWNSAEKATQVAARYAVQSDPVASNFTGFSAVADLGLPPGGSVDTGTVPAFTISCTNTSCTVTSGASPFGGGLGHDAAAFNAILLEVQKLQPQATATNVVVDYAHCGLGFAGRPGGSLVPCVTVRLTGMTWDFIVLDGIIKAMDVVLFGDTLADFQNGIPMPAFPATLTGEDLDSFGS